MESELQADISKIVICKPHPVPVTLPAPFEGLEPDHDLVQLRHSGLAVPENLSKVWTDGRCNAQPLILPYAEVLEPPKAVV